MLQLTLCVLKTSFIHFTKGNGVHKRDRKHNNVTSQNPYISIGNPYEHTCYACCACIQEKQIVVTTKFHNQSLGNLTTNELKQVTEGTKIVRALKKGILEI